MERIQKIIARSTGLSRRQAEDLVREGKVFVDGEKITTLGFKADPVVSKITVKGKVLQQAAQLQYLLFHKPKKCVVTRDDPENRKTIYDYLPPKMKSLKPVGRLDYDSEGLLLLTNDGDLAEKLTHPRHHLRKIYQVKVSPKPGPRQIQRLQQGLWLDGRRTLPARVETIEENPKSTWLRITLMEGRNRQIRRMCEAVGLTVKTLVRTSFGPLTLSGLAIGKWKLLKERPKLDLKA